MNLVYLIVGCPGSGKSWVCDQLTDLFEYVHHDGYIRHINQPEVYVEAILEAGAKASRPLLAEAPFSISQIKEPLESEGFEVVPLFILEDEEVLRERYLEREGRDIPKGHLTRQKTYAERAEEYGAFSGTSQEVLDYLKGAVRVNARQAR